VVIEANLQHRPSGLVQAGEFPAVCEVWVVRAGTRKLTASKLPISPER
jgi:hypothetical protein